MAYKLIPTLLAVFAALALLFVASANALAIDRRNHLGNEPPRPDTPEEAAAIAASKNKNKTLSPPSECKLATDCASGCCLFGDCRPDADCQRAFAPLGPVKGRTLGSTCTASTYRECSSGCCVDGKCAPHATCWGATGENFGAKCSESSLQECDSGCCHLGRCQSVSQCFPVGVGLELGATCSGGNASACASGCCGSNGTCVASSVCWPGLFAPLTPAATPKAPTTNCSRTCKAKSGDPCPCDHVCLCGECVPENNLAAKALSGVFADGSKCSESEKVLGVWRNSQLSASLPNDWVSTVIEQQEEYLKEAKVESESCAYAVGMSPVFRPCKSEGKICDPRTWTCKNATLVDVYFKRLEDACSAGEVDPQTYDVDPKKIFKTTLGWDLPKYSCTRCLTQWGPYTLITRECPSGTACDVNGIDGRPASGYCVPTVAVKNDTSVQGSLPCTGQKDFYAPANGPSECRSCYWDAVKKICLPPPGKWIETVIYMPKGTASPLVNTSWPMRNNDVITGYPDYSSPAYPYSKDAQLTYEYLSCVATHGQSADIRQDKYASDYSLQVGKWQSAVSGVLHPECLSVCQPRSAGKPSLARRTGDNKAVPACQKFSDINGDAYLNATFALAPQGASFHCPVYCHLTKEWEWLSDAVDLITVNNARLSSFSDQTWKNLQTAGARFKDAKLHVPEKKEDNTSFWTELVSFVLDVVGIFFPAEQIAAKIAGTVGKALEEALEDAEKFKKALELASAAILYGGNVNEQVNPEKPIDDAFGSALGADLKVTELFNAVQESLGNAALAFKTAVTAVISDRNKLRYLSEFVWMLDMNLAGQAQKYVLDNLQQIDDHATRSFVKQLIPSLYDMCYVNEVPDWEWDRAYCNYAGEGVYNVTRWDSDTNQDVTVSIQCAHWCDKLYKADRQLDPQPALKTKDEMTYSWATGGMKRPYLPPDSTRYNNFPQKDVDAADWPQNIGLSRTRFWICSGDQTQRKEVMGSQIWEDDLGCKWVGPKEPEDGKATGRYLCDDAMIDAQQLMFDASYFPLLDTQHPVLNGRGAHLGWPRLRTYDPTLGAMCVDYYPNYPTG